MKDFFSDHDPSKFGSEAIFILLRQRFPALYRNFFLFFFQRLFSAPLIALFYCFLLPV